MIYTKKLTYNVGESFHFQQKGPNEVKYAGLKKRKLEPNECTKEI